MDAEATDGAVLDKVLDREVPLLIEKIYGLPAPETPRTDIQQIFLTGIAEGTDGPVQQDPNSQLINEDEFVASEMLRLNLTIPPAAEPNRLGVLAKDLQGFPNGRRLTDDVVDIEIQALEGAVRTGELGEALAAGDGVNANDTVCRAVQHGVGQPDRRRERDLQRQRRDAAGRRRDRNWRRGRRAGCAGCGPSASLPGWVLATGGAGLLLLGAGSPRWPEVVAEAHPAWLTMRRRARATKLRPTPAVATPPHARLVHLRP